MAVEEDEIASLLREMLSAGALPSAPITASELRMRTRRRQRPLFDAKALVAVGVAVVLVVALFTAGPLKSGKQSPQHVQDSPTGWVAHSAYGLQISVPREWTVEVFGQCPDGKKPGTLFIGTPNVVDLCPEYGSDTTQVDMFTGGQSAFSAQHAQVIRMHGVKVLSSPVGSEQYWYVPSKHVVVTGADRKALPIMRTLALATTQAVPAVGQVNGTEYLETLTQLKVSGPITVRRIGTQHRYTVHALDGQFSFGGHPGNYLLTGGGGDTPCPSVIATIVSGRVTDAPPIRCQGI